MDVTNKLFKYSVVTVHNINEFLIFLPLIFQGDLHHKDNFYDSQCMSARTNYIV